MRRGMKGEQGELTVEEEGRLATRVLDLLGNVLLKVGATGSVWASQHEEAGARSRVLGGSRSVTRHALSAASTHRQR